MLTERAMLEDVAPNNRVLAGAKNLLLKYALCNLVRQVAQEESRDTQVVKHVCIRFCRHRL